jgi:hypothetical protein
VSHQAFELMMQISRVDKSHEKKQLRKWACNGVIAWSGQSRFKSNAVSEITARWYASAIANNPLSVSSRRTSITL